MNRGQLIHQIKRKQTYLCIGLDTDISKVPPHLFSHSDPVVAFNRQIIDATKEYCVSYKLNTAFYEAMGIKGWEALQQTLQHIPPTHFTIADAKRGDIGNTAAQYAKTFFEVYGFDAITVAPYMGCDSIQPFLEYENKWTIVLGLTSNKGSEDFQQLKVNTDIFLYEHVMRSIATLATPDNLMFVVGATKAEQLAAVRKLLPQHFFLIPGVGTQGGDLEAVAKAGLMNDGGLLVNVSRAIIYAGSGEDFAEKAAKAAKKYAGAMMHHL